MRKKWKNLLLCLLLLLGIGTAAIASGAEDPLFSISYLYDTWLPKLQALFAGESEAAFGALREDFTDRLDVLDKLGTTAWSHAGSRLALEFQDGGSLRLAPFSSFLMTEGTSMLHVVSGEVLDLTEGRLCGEGEMLLPNHRYFPAEESEALVRAYAPVTGFVEGDYLFSAQGSFSPEERFLDIGSHWGKDNILAMAEAGIVNGMTAHTFEPNRKVTRAMFVTVLGRYDGVPADYASASVFPDVKEGDWFAPYVSWSAETELAKGFEDGSFGPDREITREQMAVFLVRYCLSKDLRLPDAAEERVFTDEALIGSWALDSVRQAQRWGLINGRNDGSFDPKGSATRAEMCTIICNLTRRSAEAAALSAEAAEAAGEAEGPVPEGGEAEGSVPEGDAAEELVSEEDAAEELASEAEEAQQPAPVGPGEEG